MGFHLGSLNRALEDEVSKGSPRSIPPVEPPKHHVDTEDTFNSAIKFVQSVKHEFSGEREKYDEFLAILSQYRHERIDIATVVDRVKVLFDGHPDLILAFNEFVPSGSEAAGVGVDD